MMKLFLRVVLAGFAAVGAAGAQTPPQALTPTSTPPLPTAQVQQVAFKVMPNPVPAQPATKLAVKVFDVADLVCPPKDSPLATASDDVAMNAAVKAYTESKAEQLLNRLHSAIGSHTGTMEVTTDGHTLVARNTPAEMDRIGECLASIRKLRDTQVMLEMVLISVPSDRVEIKKLFCDKQCATMTAYELKTFLQGLKKEGAIDILSRPQLLLTNKQTGFFQVGQKLPVHTAGPDGKVQNVSYQQVGITTRATPEVSADGKFIRLKLEVQHSEPGAAIAIGNGQFATPIDSQMVDKLLVIPSGGTMAVMVGRKSTNVRTEQKVPVLGDLPYLGCLFRNVATTQGSTDTIAVVTVNRFDESVQKRVLESVPVSMGGAGVVARHPHPMPVAVPGTIYPPIPAGVTMPALPMVPPTPIGSLYCVPSVPPLPGTATVNGSPLPANAVPVTPAPIAPQKPKGTITFSLGWSSKSGLMGGVSVQQAPVAPPVRVGKIVIVGNSVTSQRVILNQLQGLSPGQPVDYTKIEEARKNLLRLQLFDTAPQPTVEVLPPSQPGSAFRDIRVTVKETEAHTGMISLQVGVKGSSILPQPVPVPVPQMVVRVLTPPHMDHLRIYRGQPVAVPGAVQQLRFTAQPGTTIQRYELPTFTPPAPAMLLPTPAMPPVPRLVRTLGSDGVERIGVAFEKIGADYHLTLPAVSAAVGGCAGHCCDSSMALMKAYKAACAAGKKDEAARLALQLLSNDPTCFGKGE